MVVVFVLWQSWSLLLLAIRLTRRCVRSGWATLKPYIVPRSLRRVFALVVLGSILCVFSKPANNLIQRIEWQLFPVYVSQDTTGREAVYLRQLYKVNDTYTASVIERRTAAMAQRLNTTPTAIYEVAYSECRLNPFTIRKDGRAAGWIQFTTAGLHGLGCTLEQVKAACLRQDIGFIMDLTEAYLQSRAKGKPMPRGVDVYTCVFAPGYLGAPDTQVLYSTADGAAYSLNSGLDGYYTKQEADRVRIYRAESAKDGKITITDLALHLAALNAKLLK
jgi:hypothetical protein